MSEPSNPADQIFSAEASAPVDFSDLTERQSVKLGAMTRYVARSHFQTWEQLRRMPDFDALTGIFTPLVCLDIEVTDAKVRPGEVLTARGKSAFGKVLNGRGEVRQITRDGLHELFGAGGQNLGSVRFVNVFTRYEKDPAKRKVLEIPVELGVGRRIVALLEQRLRVALQNLADEARPVDQRRLEQVDLLVLAAAANQAARRRGA